MASYPDEAPMLIGSNALGLCDRFFYVQPFEVLGGLLVVVIRTDPIFLLSWLA